MRLRRSPCQDCKDRQIGCHGRCDRYKEFKIKLGRGVDARNAEHQIRGVEFEAIRRAKKNG